jgi:hypothetical protein
MGICLRALVASSKAAKGALLLGDHLGSTRQECWFPPKSTRLASPGADGWTAVATGEGRERRCGSTESTEQTDETQ